MRLFSTILLPLTALNVSAQYYGQEKVSREQLRPWIANSSKEYSVTYHFGFSEGECELRIFVDDTIFAAQSSCYTWRESLGGFIDTFYTFTNVRIGDNKFYSDESDGEFLILTRGNNVIAGLLLYQPWTYQFYSGGEFGSVLPDGNSVFLPGDYPDASKRLLTEEELQKLKAKALRRMRNEIFARYGYKFQEGGEMSKHFRSRNWYQANYDKVDQWFTEIEIKNIEAIEKAEEKK